MVVLEWLRGKTLFVTGGTGFMGKVLIEKLLRCSEVKRIYMLVRPKRGMGATARIDNMAKIPLFSKLMEMNPAAIKKIIPLEGDITEENLGLKKEDILRLVQETEIVFNFAASLRLEAELKMAVEHNTLSTYRMLQLARQMKKLQVFTHLSTAFCHCELEVLEEKTYPNAVSPHDIMNIVRWMDDDTLRKITPKLLGPHPNCYTFSKRLAEDLVAEEKNNLPVCIVRPSIVVATIEEPLPGWVDSLNGPMGILVGSGKGVIKTVLCNANYNIETIPVDIAINAVILAACKKATLLKEGELPVYNASTSHIIKITWGELLEKARKIVYEYPFEGGIWYPEGNIRTNRFVHWLIIIFLHYLPAYLIDFLMILIRQKRFMVRLQDRITVGLGVLEYFTTKPWNFRIDNGLVLHDHLTEQEKKIFYIDNVDQDIDRFLVKTVLGARQYLMKEPLSSLPRARRHQMMLYIISRVTRVLVLGLLAWWTLQLLLRIQAYFGYSFQGLAEIPVIGEYVSLKKSIKF